MTAPENLAGISASVSLDGAKVEFEDVQLELGQMAEGHVSPMQLPLILGQIKLLLILGLINTLQNITLPLLMTNGGPGYDSYTPGLYMYFQAFRLGSYSMANTIATVMFVIILVLTIISTRLRSKMDA